MGRLDYIEIEVNDGTITLPWYSRETVIREVGATEDREEIRNAFEAAGTTRPVELTDEQRSELLNILDLWCQRDTAEGLPEGVDDLRRELTEEAETANR
jgi:hypothetical protein